MRCWSVVLLCSLVCLPGLGQRNEAVEVPFDFLHNQIVLSVTFEGGGPYRFVLDSGTHASTIDIGLARRLRLPLAVERTRSVGAGSRRATARVTLLRELHVGELTVHSLPAAALDLSHLSRQMGRRLDGVLGHSFLSSRILQIDYFHRRIRIYGESPFTPGPRPPDTPRRVSFPMQFLSNSILPVVEDCQVNGTKLTVSLDTGSSLGLVLFPAAVRSLGLEELARQGVLLNATGYRGRARLRKGWARSVLLKTIDLGAIEVAYVERGYGDEEGMERRGGSFGNAVLQDFTLTLDYRNRVVVLESVAD